MTGQRPSETKRSAAVASNSLLASLPRTAFAALEPHLTEVSLPKGAILQRISDGPDGIHFPTDGIASFQSIMKDGTAIDTAIVGRDDAVGLLPLSGARCITRTPMMAAKISRTTFRRLAFSNAAIHMLEVKFGEALLGKTQTTAVRYAYLSAVEQLAARLLEVAHLLRSNSIPLTQEALGEMLAVRRSSVTESAIELKRAGLIAYSRGTITIRDRAGLRKLTLATNGLT
jgi:CRP-like cAMP-binding protein